MFKKMKKKQKGFTLVELIVVVAILGVLATLLVPKIMGNVEESRKQTAIANARTIASEITMHNAMLDKGDELLLKINGKADFSEIHEMSEDDYTAMTTYTDIIIDEKGNASVQLKK
jgi:prepilin-type N-terminal cleavage/methylation domain-containing protein